METQVEMEVILVSLVRARPKHRGEITAGAGSQALERGRQRQLHIGIADRDTASVGELETRHVDGIAPRMLAQLAGAVAVAVAALETSAGGNRLERRSGMRSDDGRGGLGNP